MATIQAHAPPAGRTMAPVLPRQSPALRRVTVALIALEGLAVAIDLIAGHQASLHWEERVNARNGALFACGHLGHWATLQYRTFCGGCTAEGLLAAPVFLALGATVGAWKAVIAGLHLGVVAASAALARRLGDWGAAAWAVALLGAAPGFYREQALTGWGNHAESSLFPLLAALCLLHARGAAGGGLLLGLGTWFAPITAHAVPALAALAGRSPARLAALAAGTVVGLLPIAAFLRARPAGAQESTALWSQLSLAPPADLLGFLSTRGIGGGLWSPLEYGDLHGLDLAWWGLLWGLGLLGAAGQARRGAVGRGVLALALGGLVAAYGLRHDLWAQLPEFPDHPTFNLRYLAPLVPWLVLGAALVPGLGARGRRPAAALLVGLITAGVGLRIATWEHWQPERLGAPLVLQAERLDRTVPLGQPPQPNRRQQGRPQDLAAALAWLEGHDDPLETCRAVHAGELGRRLGRAADPAPWVARAAAATPSPQARALLVDGAARALGPAADPHTTLAAFGPLDEDLGIAWGRLLAPEHRGLSPEVLGRSLPEPLVRGICAARLGHLGPTGFAGRPGWHQEDPGPLAGCPPP